LLSIADGLQLPVIPLEDVAGSAGALLPLHTVNEVPKLNVGVTIGLTVTEIADVIAHCPAVGVNT
jgi:hypothetical protein